jgi:hypothetical protein
LTDFFSELTVAMLIKLAAVVFFTPVFLFAGILVGGIGAVCGQIYMGKYPDFCPYYLTHRPSSVATQCKARDE